MKRQPTFLFPITAIAFASLFSACGQSGPLYIPGDPSTIAVPPAENAGTEEKKKEGESAPTN